MADDKLMETGCYLDSHRGHYIQRDVVLLAIDYGFIIGPLEKWALDTYEASWHEPEYPCEAISELAMDAVDWFNSGQDTCDMCCRGSHRADWPGPGWVPTNWPGPGWVPTEYVSDGFNGSVNVVRRAPWVICKSCNGTGRGPRITGQNFPPRVPPGCYWGFNDGDFGLYFDEEDEL